MFRPGAAAIARLGRAMVVPVAIRYEMGATPKPELWLSVGEPIEGKEQAAQEGAVARELARIEAALATDEFPVAHRQSGSAMLRLAEASLAWLTRL